MNKRKWVAVIICAVLTLTVFGIGFSGKVVLAKQREQESMETDPMETDHLIGVLITEDSIVSFDVESYLENHISELVNGEEIDMPEISANNQRIYATNTLNDDNSYEFRFEGIKGIRFCSCYIDPEENGKGYWRSWAEEGCGNSHWKLNETEDTIRIEGECTVFSKISSYERIFFMNPIYQTSDGRIYVIPGRGEAFSRDIAYYTASSSTLNEKKTMTINGETKTFEAEIKVNFSFLDPPTSVTLLQYDEENLVIAKQIINADSIPDEIIPLNNTRYLIIESEVSSPDGTKTTERQLIQRKDNHGEIFSVREDEICVQHLVEIAWQN